MPKSMTAIDNLWAGKAAPQKKHRQRKYGN